MGFDSVDDAARTLTEQPQQIKWAPHMTPFAIKTYIDAGFDVVGAPEVWK
jgi:hypothetical protein